MKSTLSKIGILTAIVTAALTTNYLHAAWENPPSDPPTNNTPAPLNVGDTNQVKSAGLSLEALVINGPVQIQDGTEANGSVLLSDGTGVASWVATSSLGIASESETPADCAATGNLPAGEHLEVQVVKSITYWVTLHQCVNGTWESAGPGWQSWESEEQA